VTLVFAPDESYELTQHLHTLLCCSVLVLTHVLHRLCLLGCVEGAEYLWGVIWGG
jgi:hypothetical protein